MRTHCKSKVIYDAEGNQCLLSYPTLLFADILNMLQNGRTRSRSRQEVVCEWYTEFPGLEKSNRFYLRWLQLKMLLELGMEEYSATFKYN